MAQHPYWLIVISLGFALAPVVIGLFTAFLKVHVVLSFFRSGLGAQQVPSGLVILAISCALTLAIMNPTLTAFQSAVDDFPWQRLKHSPDRIKAEEIAPLLAPWREFLIAHTGEREKLAFQRLARGSLKSHDPESAPPPAEPAELSWSVLLPAFVVTELREAFLIGFVILLPFLAIDLIVAHILAGVGMFMVSPVMISLPLKVALFTIADGWLLFTHGLVDSYRIGVM